MGKKQNKGGQQAQAQQVEVQQAAKLPPYLQQFERELTLLDRFMSGETAVEAEMQAAFKAAREVDANRGSLDGVIGSLIVVHGFEPSLFATVFGGDKNSGFKARLAEEFVRCAREANTRIGAWSKKEAQRVLSAWAEKHPATAPSQRKGVLATLAAGGNAVPFETLSRWANAERRDHEDERDLNRAIDASKKKAEIESKIAAVEAKINTARTAGTKARDIVPLEDELEALQAQLTAAETSKDNDVAADEPEPAIVATPSIADQIMALEAKINTARTAGTKARDIVPLEDELEALQAQLTAAETSTAQAPPAASATAAEAAPTVVAEVLTLSQAIEACKSSKNVRLEKVLARYKAGDENLNDMEFVRTVQSLMS